MTYPPDPQQPHPMPDQGPAGGPPQYEPPQYEPPQYGPPQYGPPQYGPPQGTPDYGTPQYGTPQYGTAPYAPVDYGKPPQPGRRRLLVAASIVLVLAAAGVVSWLALRDKSSGVGADNPQAAVQSIVDDLTKSDILGVLDHLPPAERNALRDSVTDSVNQAKRLKVLDSSADPGKVAGVQVEATGLTFDPTPETVNDHVQIVKVTGGTFTINSDASSVPYTKQFLDAAFPDGAPTGTSTDTIDIGQAVRDSGEPVRIAVQKVDGKWYPSVLYTIVDNANHDAGNNNPRAADAIAPDGANSPTDAVRALIDAALRNDPEAAIAVVDPVEGAALHDYGHVLLSQSGGGTSNATVDDISFSTKSVSGGSLVSFKSVTVTQDGEQVMVSVEGDCVKIASSGESHTYCSQKLFDELADHGYDLTDEQKLALTHLITAVRGVGVVTTKTDGKWYVAPIRTYADLGTTVLSGLRGNDLIVLIELANQ